VNFTEFKKTIKFVNFAEFLIADDRRWEEIRSRCARRGLFWNSET